MRRNILITSAGRRGKLVLIFQRELAATVPGGKVFATDMRPNLSVACQLAHGCFAVPPVDDPAYVEQLLDLCDAHEIGLVVPTIDPELPVLAARRDEFASRGVMAVVSDSDFVRTCRDKRRITHWFQALGLQSPRLINPRSVPRFPMFAKPYDGSCSQDTHVIESSDDLTVALLADSRMMFVEYLSPLAHDEYTIDMYYSRDGELKCLVPRLRMETRAGEVSKGRTRRIPAVDVLRERLGIIQGARGCVTLQVFVHRQSQAVYGIEINPRFGGGYPLSYEAGANFPRWLLREYLLGKSVEFFDAWESDVTMLRYDDHVIVRGTAA
jgi:carbamoyl-phosphate synthase large subunit